MSALNVLYVDDHQDVREVVELSLQLDPEVTVEVVDLGAAALDLIDSGKFNPGVFLLDVMMPAMDGPALLNAIRARSAHARTPVIFVTARTRSSEISAYRELDIAGLVTKPFDPVSFAPDIRAILAGCA